MLPEPHHPGLGRAEEPCPQTRHPGHSLHLSEHRAAVSDEKLHFRIGSVNKTRGLALGVSAHGLRATARLVGLASAGSA